MPWAMLWGSSRSVVAGWQWQLRTDMHLRAGFGQFPLALALAGTVFLLLGGMGMAAWAAHTGFIFWRLQGSVCQRLAAGAAQLVVARC
jgi:hypothetical protein